MNGLEGHDDLHDGLACLSQRMYKYFDYVLNGKELNDQPMDC